MRFEHDLIEQVGGFIDLPDELGIAFHIGLNWVNVLLEENIGDFKSEPSTLDVPNETEDGLL